MNTIVQHPDYTRSLIEANLDSLVVIDLEGKILEVNDVTLQVTGEDRETIMGNKFETFFTEPIQAKAGYQKAIEKGTVSDYSLTLKNKNGQLTEVICKASVYHNSEGKVQGVFVSTRDISEQKWTKDMLNAKKEILYLTNEKEKLEDENKELKAIRYSLELSAQYSRSLIEASRDPLVTINADGKITDVNEASIRVTGIPRESIIGTNFTTYFTDPEKAQAGYEEAFDKGFVKDYALTIEHDNGKLTSVLYNASVYKDKEGHVLGVFASARDVTDQVRIQLELTNLKELAELTTVVAEEAKRKAEKATRIAREAVNAKQQFLSNMSHEIRTPMNAIIGFSKVVLKTDLTAKQKEYLKAIKVSGDAMIVLINDILDLAKVNSGKLTFEEKPFKMETSITTMLLLFEPKIREKNLKFVKEYDCNIPKVLLGDTVRLHQIIINLISNALKFTNKGEIKLSVEIESEDEKQIKIKFSIKDTGIGIAEEKIEKIFENFQQASSSTTRLYGGTGLGLAIVKKLVEAQGGKVCVISEMGKGSTFSFSLSFLKTTEEAELINEAYELDKEIKDINVLVVEDIPLNQLLMKTLLDDYEFNCDIAENGRKAIEKMENNIYDIILMDLQMPEMNGFEATEYIRKTLKSNIPILALTADVTTVDLEKCKEAGMNDYLAKPVDDKKLYTKIIALVKNPEINTLRPKRNKKIILSEPVTQLDYLYKLTKSNPKLIQEMISLYLAQTPELIQAMTHSFNNKEWPTLQSAVHKMIPSFKIIGMSAKFEEMARKIQNFDGDLDNIALITVHVRELETACNQACMELKEEYKRLENA